MILSTLCYLQRDEQMLMLLRNKKQVDVNAGKWIGVGGKFLPGESPEECVVRETFEETGLTLDAMTLRGLLTFASEGWEDECIFVFVSNAFHGNIVFAQPGVIQRSYFRLKTGTHHFIYPFIYFIIKYISVSSQPNK